MKSVESEQTWYEVYVYCIAHTEKICWFKFAYNDDWQKSPDEPFVKGKAKKEKKKKRFQEYQSKSVIVISWDRIERHKNYEFK